MILANEIETIKRELSLHNSRILSCRRMASAPVSGGGGADHDLLSSTHLDTAPAAVIRGDIIIGSVAAPNTKWTRLAVGASTTYLAGGTEPSWATLNQAAITGLTTSDGPSFNHVHLTVAFGTAPMVVTSTTMVSNLNADMLDGYHEGSFVLLGGRVGGQTIYGGTASGSLYLATNAGATKGKIYLGVASWYDDNANNLMIANDSGQFGANAYGCIGLNDSGAPSSSPANVIQLYSIDYNAVANKQCLHIRNEDGTVVRLNQDVSTLASPTWAGVTIGTLAGILKGTAGAVSAVTTTTSADYMGGDMAYHTLNQAAVAGLTTSDGPTFDHVHASIVVPNGGTIGQAAGPLLNFDDTNNYLEITGCNVGIGSTTPGTLLEITNSYSYPNDKITLHCDNPSGSSPVSPGTIVWEYDSYIMGRITMSQDDPGSSWLNRFDFLLTSAGGAPVRVMTIDSTALLAVSGKITMPGNRAFCQNHTDSTGTSRAFGIWNENTAYGTCDIMASNGVDDILDTRIAYFTAAGNFWVSGDCSALTFTDRP